MTHKLDVDPVNPRPPRDVQPFHLRCRRGDRDWFKRMCRAHGIAQWAGFAALRAAWQQQQEQRQAAAAAEQGESQCEKK